MKCNQSRIWTRGAVSNSCDDNHYTTVTLFVLLHSLIDMWSVGIDISIRKACFSCILLNLYIWSIVRSFSQRLDSKKKSFFWFCWLFLVDIYTIFAIQNSILFIYFPMNVMSYFITSQEFIRTWEFWVLETCCLSDSSESLSANGGMKNSEGKWITM